MNPRTEYRKAEREAQGLEDRVMRLVKQRLPIPRTLMFQLKAARSQALQFGPVRRPASRPSISEASAR